MEFVAKGNQFFVNEEYDKAIEEYSNAIKKTSFPYEAHFGRARCRISLRKYKLAIEDLNQCVASRPQDGLANYYLGHCIRMTYHTDFKQMEIAQKLLQTAKKSRKNDTRISIELNKCLGILKNLRPKVEVKSKNQPLSNNNDNNNNKHSNNKSPKKNSPPKNNNNKETPTPKKPEFSLRDTYIQTADSVFVTIYVKNLTQEDIKVTFESSRVIVKIMFPQNNSNFTDFPLEYTRAFNLSNTINVKKSNFRVTKYKINLTLSKSQAGLNWKELEKPIDETKLEKKQKFTNQPWTTNKNWDQVDKYAKEELEKEKPEGEEALQSLFQSIYANGNDEQKKAMMKSFQTSHTGEPLAKIR